jgi:hypothetical protein
MACQEKYDKNNKNNMINSDNLIKQSQVKTDNFLPPKPRKYRYCATHIIISNKYMQLDRKICQSRNFFVYAYRS